MRIQPQNNLQFKGKEHITSPQKLAGMVRHLESKQRSYKVHENHIYWSRELTALVRTLLNEAKNPVKLAEEKPFNPYEYAIGVKKAIAEWRLKKAKAQKLEKQLINAEKIKLDEIKYGKKIGTQGLRLKKKP